MHKVQKDRLGPFLTDYTRERLEAIAAEILGPDRIRDHCSAAAEKGLTRCMFAPDVPINLKGTKIAAEVMRWLAREGLQGAWEVRRDMAEGVDYPCLVVEWGIFS
jgi:hypothetical protein